MQLTKVKVLKYKSIVNPIEINLNDRDMVVFIGKNGCGKTNLLQALKIALEDSRYSRKADLKAEYVFKLTEKEKKEFFSDFEFNSDDKDITIIFDGQEPSIKRIQAPLFKVMVKEYKIAGETLFNEFKQATKEYLEQLRLIESEHPFYYAYNLEVNDRCGQHALQKDEVNRVEQLFNDQIEQISSFLNTFSRDEITIDKYNIILDFYLPFNYDFRLNELTEQGIDMHPFIAECLDLTPEKIEEANKKIVLKIKDINEKLRDNYKKIGDVLDRFKVLKKEIDKVFSRKDEEYYAIKKQLEQRQGTFIDLLRKAAFGKCYYIDNENSLLFYADRDAYDYRARNSEFNLNSRNPILEAIDTYLKENKYYKCDEESIFQNKITTKRYEEIVKILNKEFLPQMVPDFEKEENIKYEFNYEDNRLQLYVIEKGKQKISFDNTSLGRRWYLTYKFITKLLKKGNYLFIDEPATFLHPNAQTTIKNELQKLKKEGIYVFITTHSPYMIPEKWNNVISLSNTENGTEAKTFSSEDELCGEIQKELCNIRTTDILFNLSKTLLLVEGEADKACIVKFAELLNYNLDNYHIHVCDGDSIVQMSYLCIFDNIKFIAIADNDNRYKPEKYMKGHPNFEKCLSEIEKNEDKCIFIGEGKTGNLEDLFKNEKDKYFYYEQDQNKYKLSQYKINEIKSIDELDNCTIEAFKDLFKRIGLKNKKSIY